ncbi:hypothetical protein SAMN06295888_10276 [Desulfonatronum zhilinae]|nr:hypothetical protein SAMN06295888_10276 [Desulfonatronum zhilinae]
MQPDKDNSLLTPSEIEALRKDKKEAHEQLKGRSKHLFEGLTVAPAKGGDDGPVSSINRLLTPSEIESLRQDLKQGVEQLKGRSKHLFENLKDRQG